jgi:hypothetical protein
MFTRKKPSAPPPHTIKPERVAVPTDNPFLATHSVLERPVPPTERPPPEPEKPASSPPSKRLL